MEDKDENTLIGISKSVRDKAKIHVVRFQHKYNNVTDLVTKAVSQQIEDDEHDAAASA